MGELIDQGVRISAQIPFVDLIVPHLELQEELLEVFRAALRTGTFVGGSIVEDFEREFARYCGTRHCVGVSSGTDALKLALIAAGVRPGDIVLTVPNTFIATAEAISHTGARPDFINAPQRRRVVGAAPRTPAQRPAHSRVQTTTDPSPPRPVQTQFMATAAPRLLRSERPGRVAAAIDAASQRQGKRSAPSPAADRKRVSPASR